MWHIVRNSLLTLAALAFMVWTGLLWTILAAVPTWTYLLTIGIGLALIVLVVKLWQQNEVSEFVPQEEPNDTDDTDD
jgi:hypothetical protein